MCSGPINPLQPQQETSTQHPDLQAFPITLERFISSEDRCVNHKVHAMITSRVFRSSFHDTPQSSVRQEHRNPAGMRQSPPT
jgi:hypothetical protein